MKKIQTKSWMVGTLVVLMMLVADAARAVTILDVTSALTVGDPTQLGRLNRNGVPSDWSATKAFPGVLNATTSYSYHVFSVNVGITPFIQISFDSLSINMFVSAYDTTYTPPPSTTNYLGDGGFSGDPVPGDPQFFNVVAPVNHNLLVVVNGTGTGINNGVGDPFHLQVEGFIDTEYTDPLVSAVPEPATLFLSGTGLALLARRRARRQRRGH